MRLGRDSVARRIEDALKHGRFREGSLLAETVVPQTADLRLLILCSMVFFLTDRFQESEDFLKRAKRIDDAYPAANEFESFIKLKSASSRDEASIAYLTLSDAFPKVKRYEKILSEIRTVRNFESFQKKVSLVDLVRPAAVLSDKKHVRRQSSLRLPSVRWIIVIPAVFVAVGALAGVYKGISLARKDHSPGGMVSEPSYIDTVTLENEKYPLLDKLVHQKQEFFFYDESQIKTLFDRAKRELKDQKYNESIISINTILLSNANIAVKERAEFLKKFLPDPSKIIPMKVEPSELFKMKNLYEGAVVSFSGKAANVEREGGKTTLSLLVNFSEKTRFDGVVEIFYDADADISNGDTVEMNGYIIHPSVADGKPYMQAVKLKKK